MGEHVGTMVHNVKLKVRDCEKVIVDGTTYRDVTPMFFEETKYRKTYPTADEWEKIHAYEYRKARVKKAERDRQIEKERLRLEEERQQIEKEERKGERAKEREEKRKKKMEKERVKRELKEIIFKKLKSGVMRKGLYDLGFTTHEVKRAIDALDKEGRWEKRKAINYTEKEDKIIIQMRKDGKRFIDIAERLGRKTGSIDHRYRFLIERDNA